LYWVAIAILRMPELSAFAELSYRSR